MSLLKVTAFTKHMDLPVGAYLCVEMMSGDMTTRFYAASAEEVQAVHDALTTGLKAVAEVQQRTRRMGETA